MHNRYLDVEWDLTKARSNIAKHGVAFSDAVGVLEDPDALTIEDDHNHRVRFMTIELDFIGRLLVIVYIWREDCVRLISARSATGTERRNYERGLQ